MELCICPLIEPYRRYLCLPAFPRPVHKLVLMIESVVCGAIHEAFLHDPCGQDLFDLLNHPLIEDDIIRLERRIDLYPPQHDVVSEPDIGLGYAVTSAHPVYGDEIYWDSEGFAVPYLRFERFEVFKVIGFLIKELLDFRVARSIDEFVHADSNVLVEQMSGLPLAVMLKRLVEQSHVSHRIVMRNMWPFFSREYMVIDLYINPVYRDTSFKEQIEPCSSQFLFPRKRISPQKIFHLDPWNLKHYPFLHFNTLPDYLLG